MEESQENQQEQAGENQQEQAQVEEETPVIVESNPVEELEKQLAQAKREAAEFKDKFLRERAEMDNFRKRQERIAGDRIQREKKDMILKILSVMDNVERALV